MTTGVPPIFRNVANKIYTLFPNQRKHLYRMYELYLEMYLYYLKKRHCIEPPHIGIEETQLLYVDPHKIRVANDPGFIFNLDSDCKVIGGNWHKNLPEFNEIFPYSAFEKRFKDNENWENTSMHPFLKRMFDAERSMGGYTSFSEVEGRLNEIDNLFYDIKQNGYKTQREILASQDDHAIGIPEWLCERPPECHEIAVDIGPDGEFIFEDGRHRLAIAKLLNLETIPVQVVVRHSLWQKKRTEYVSKPDLIKQSLHPDMQILDKYI